MPYTRSERKLYASLKKQYGARADEVYDAMLNSGKHEKVFGARSKKKRATAKKRAKSSGSKRKRGKKYGKRKKH